MPISFLVKNRQEDSSEQVTGETGRQSAFSVVSPANTGKFV